MNSRILSPSVERWNTGQKYNHFRIVGAMSGKTIWFTGLSGSGKSTLAGAVKKIVEEKGYPAVLLDGDVLRGGINRDLGFSALDRAENIRRASEIAKILNDLDHIVFAAFITPVESLREAVRKVFDPNEFVEIFLDCPLSVCEARDPKGIYAKARKGIIKEFTGISAPFQPPESADLTVNTDRCDLKDSISSVMVFLEQRFPEFKTTHKTKFSKNFQSRKVAVIGLDCAPPSIIFDEYLGLTNIRSLMKHGVWGPLRSTDPPITVPAWTTITTGRDPGELGLYGFRNRLTRDHYNMVTVNSSHVSYPRVWDFLDRDGKKSILIGIPQTFPARPHSGVTIAGFPAIENSKDFSYPTNLMDDLSCLGNEPYLADVKDFRSLPKETLLQNLYSMADQRFGAARELLLKEPWDFFMMVEIAPDRLQHAFWGYFDGNRQTDESGERWGNVIPDFYKYLDQKIGEILGLLDDDTTVLIISDHGARSSTGGFCVNEWLIRRGLLTLKQYPQQETKLTEDLIDWEKTHVWSEGGYYARIFMNVKGREPHGIIESSEYEKFRDGLRDEIVSIKGSNGERLANVALKPEELYRTVNGIAPDLIVYFDSLNKRSIGNVGVKELVIKGEGIGLDACNHDPEGIFIATRLGDLRQGARKDIFLSSQACGDITPTILAEYGVKIPVELPGKVIPLDRDNRTVMFSEKIVDSVSFEVSKSSYEDRGFTAAEEEIVRKRLSDLGYI